MYLGAKQHPVGASNPYPPSGAHIAQPLNPHRVEMLPKREQIVKMMEVRHNLS